MGDADASGISGKGVCEGAMVVLAGNVADVKSATDELRAASGGDMGESHMAICLPGKVWNTF